MREYGPLPERLNTFQALVDGGFTVEYAARRMGVSVRSARRYLQILRQQNGIPSPQGAVAQRLRPLVLDLLRRHLDTAFTAWELSRGVGHHAALSTNSGLLPALIAEGLVEVVDGDRASRGSGPVRRYRLAPTTNDTQINTEREAD